jgi:hypothetical protein
VEPKKWEPKEGEYFIREKPGAFIELHRLMARRTEYWSGHEKRWLESYQDDPRRPLAPGEAVIELKPGGEPVLATMASEAEWPAPESRIEMQPWGFYTVKLGSVPHWARLYHFGQDDAFKLEEPK